MIILTGYRKRVIYSFYYHEVLPNIYQSNCVTGDFLKSSGFFVKKAWWGFASFHHFMLGVFIKLKMRGYVLITPVFFLSIFFLIMNLSFPLSTFSYAVTTDSMEPAIPAGSLVYVRKEGVYSRGDIITFKTKTNQVITHRIVDQDSNKFITQGDANVGSDSEMIKENQIIGKTFLTIPHIGAIILDIKNLVKT